MIIFELHYLDYQFLAQPLHTYTLLSVPSLVFTLSLIDRLWMLERPSLLGRLQTGFILPQQRTAPLLNLPSHLNISNSHRPPAPCSHHQSVLALAHLINDDLSLRAWGTQGMKRGQVSVF